MKRVGQEYPNPRVNEGRRKLWLRDDLDQAILPPDLQRVRDVIEFAVGATRPDLTLLLWVSDEISLARQRERNIADHAVSDRFEGAGRAFFARVLEGYRALADDEPNRVRVVDALPPVAEVHQRVWQWVEACLSRSG